MESEHNESNTGNVLNSLCNNQKGDKEYNSGLETMKDTILTEMNKSVNEILKNRAYQTIGGTLDQSNVSFRDKNNDSFISRKVEK